MSKKELAKIIGIALASLLLFTGLFFSISHARNTVFEIHINDLTFPDCGFRNYVFNEIDLNDDGLLTKDEIMRTTTIAEIYVDTYDLKGIEYFTNLRSLDINGSDVKYVNLSNNHNLQELNITGTSIDFIDLSGNPLLYKGNVYADEGTIIIFAE